VCVCVCVCVCAVFDYLKIHLAIIYVSKVMFQK